jgi:hypothetical protein
VGVVHDTDIAATTSFATLGIPPRNFGGAPDDAVGPRPLPRRPHTRDLNPSNLTTKEMRDASR